MADRVLRDECDHGRYDEHTYLAEGGHPESSIAYKDCPGGREVTIDRKAAADQLGLIDWIAMQTKHPSSVEMPPYEWLLAEATAIVDAALGVTDG